MKYALIFTLLLAGNALHALTQEEFKRREELLRTAIKSVAAACEADTTRIAAQRIAADCDTTKRMVLNRIFAAQFEQALRQDSAFFYPFAAIPYVYQVSSRNGLVRVLTWLVPMPDGNRYFGFALTRKNRSDTKATITVLHDRRRTTRLVENAELAANEWFGALYTAIVERPIPYTNETLYTLVGISPIGGSSPSNKKIVDVLNVKPDGTCTFGAPVFVRKNTVNHRMIFEYSAQAVMELRYVESTRMIVFSTLQPMYPQLRGRYEHYIPGENFDAVRFENGEWRLREGVRPPSNIPVRTRGRYDRRTGLRT